MGKALSEKFQTIDGHELEQRIHTIEQRLTGQQCSQKQRRTISERICDQKHQRALDSYERAVHVWNQESHKINS